MIWVTPGEIFPNQMRGSAPAVAGAVRWTSNFTVTVTFPFPLASIGLAGTYDIYTVAAVLTVFLVLRGLHETHDRKLEQMGRLAGWGERVPSDAAMRPSRA
jgi:SP family sugar:H+ symporter-like MFS transporter